MCGLNRLRQRAVPIVGRRADESIGVSTQLDLELGANAGQDVVERGWKRLI